MKTNLKFIMIALFTLAITGCSPEDGKDGIDGIDGQQGIPGEDGNANISAYSFAVNRADWNGGAHYGEGNIFSDYPITPDLIGGNSTSSILSEGGAVLIYANFLSVGDFMLMPASFSYMGIGVKLTASLNRGVLFISKTTNGWDNIAIANNEIPEIINYKIVLIPKEAAGRMAKDPNINLSNYEEVMSYFGKEKNLE